MYKTGKHIHQGNVGIQTGLYYFHKRIKVNTKSHYKIFSYKVVVLILTSFLFTHTFSVFGQDTLEAENRFNKRRFTGVVVAGVSAYGISMAGLNEAWYKNKARSGLHFFEDQHQWEQVDKAGHFYSTYHLSHISSRIFEWTGISSRKSIWMGAITGIALMLPIELQDGFSKDYGASWSDILANSAGAALTLQRLWWQQPRIHPKFSFHLTPFADSRPAMLGANLPQRMLKDYNGQTYWLAFDVQPWLGKESKFPAWLNLALGYGASNMLYADKSVNQRNGYDTYRQYYVSLDINFTRIPTENKFIRSFFFLLNTIHIPAPALEFNKKGMKFHPLYF